MKQLMLILVLILSVSLFSSDQEQIIIKIQNATNALQAKDYQTAIDEANDILNTKGLDREFQSACYLTLYYAYKETNNKQADKYKIIIEEYKDTDSYKQFQEIYSVDESFDELLKSKNKNKIKKSLEDTISLSSKISPEEKINTIKKAKSIITDLDVNPYYFIVIESLIVNNDLYKAQELLDKLAKEDQNFAKSPKYTLLQYNIYVKSDNCDEKAKELENNLEKVKLSDLDLLKFYSIRENYYSEKDPEKAKKYQNKTNELIKKLYSNHPGYRSDIMERKDDFPVADNNSPKEANNNPISIYSIYAIVLILIVIIIVLIKKIKEVNKIK
ncbi:MAG: hypothetical protein IJS60_07940 [Abditibacteriota bacterium]|nr:hypothetical protein [Abditibacteriota bacterium]